MVSNSFRPTFRQVKQSLRGFLLQEVGSLDAVLQEIASEITLAEVYPYFSSNVDVARYPVLMLEQKAERHSWEAMNTSPTVGAVAGPGPILSTAFEMNIWGFSHGFSEEQNEDILAEIGAWLGSVLNRRHEPFASESFEFYFDDAAPVASVNYGLSQGGGNRIVPSLSAIVTISSQYHAPQSGGI